MPRPAASCPVAPALPHCMPRIAAHPSCPGCNCQKPHLSSLFHPILPYSPHPSHPFYSILSYPSHLSPCTARPGTPGMLSRHFRSRCPFEVFRLAQFSVDATVSCIPAIEKGLHRKSTIQPLLGGERGIRTPVPLLATTRFPGVPLKPLEHLSKAGANILIIFICTKKCRSFGKSTRLIRQLQPVRLRKSLSLWQLS